MFEAKVMDIRKVLLNGRDIRIGDNNVVTGSGFRTPLAAGGYFIHRRGEFGISP